MHPLTYSPGTILEVTLSTLELSPCICSVRFLYSDNLRVFAAFTEQQNPESVGIRWNIFEHAIF